MKIIRQRPDLQDYRNRDYACHLLDDKTFDIMNDGEYGPFLMMTGCLDALEQYPAGSMVSTGKRYYDCSLVSRQYSAKQIKDMDDLASKLIAEILAEEKLS